MANWYNAKIRFQKEDEAGSLKTIMESYLIDSVSFTEAEARAYKLITTGSSDFSVPSLTRVRLADVLIHQQGAQWFKVKVVYFTVDERSGKEKRIVNQILVNADGIHQALERIDEGLKQMLLPYEITDIYLTTILDVFPYTITEDNETQQS